MNISKSLIKSSESSIPTEKRTKVGVMPFQALIPLA